MTQFVKLKELCILITDGSHFSPSQVADGFPMLTVKDMVFDGFDYSEAYKISSEDYEFVKKSGCVPEKNDVLIAKDGSYLKHIFVIKKEKEEAILSSIGILRPDLNKVNPYYLKYYLSTPFIKKQVARKYVSGSALPRIVLKNFKDIDIRYIPLDEQNKNVEILKNIDEKIRLKIDTNNLLENLLKKTFEHFILRFCHPIDCDSKIKNDTNKYHFDSKFNGYIPNGWKCGNLIDNELCKAISSGVSYFNKKNYIPTANINKEIIEDGEDVTFDNRESRANMEPKKLSVWFAKMKNSVKHLSIPENGQWFVDKYILSTGFEGLQCNINSFPYVHCFINSSYFEKHKDILSHGATQESVNDFDLNSIKFIIPDNDSLTKFSKFANPILEQKFTNIREIQELQKLKNFLLPLLMNGQASFR